VKTSDTLCVGYVRVQLCYRDLLHCAGVWRGEWAKGSEIRKWFSRCFKPWLV